MVLPPVVPGYLLLVLFGNRGLIGGFLHQHFGLQLAFNWKGAVLASATMAFPLMVQPVRLAFQMIDRRSEEHTSELQSLMRISYAVFCLKKKNTTLHTPKVNILTTT